MILEKPDFAFELTLSEDLVKEPEAGIPDKNAQPIFATPKESASRSLLILLPDLEAKDLPIDKPSIKQSNARAMEVWKIISQLLIESSKFGSDTGI